jgi:hypothetical protein
MSHLNGTLAAACFAMAVLLTPSAGHAQAQQRAIKAMQLLKSVTAKLGAPRIEGNEAVGGKDAPALYFGTTKMNNNFDIVDAVGKENGERMTAALFVKGGYEYIMVTTSTPKPAGSGRVIGTILSGPALNAIRQGKAYYDDLTGVGEYAVYYSYEPIEDGAGNIIGVYCVGSEPIPDPPAT